MPMNLNIFNLPAIALISVVSLSSSGFAMEDDTQPGEEVHKHKVVRVIAPALLRNMLNGINAYETDTHLYTPTWKTYRDEDHLAQAQRNEEVARNMQRQQYAATYAPILQVNAEEDQKIMAELDVGNILIDLNTTSFSQSTPQNISYETSVYTMQGAVSQENWLMHLKFEETPK